MKLGLYSEIGRRNILTAREFVKKNKFNITDKDIRRFRKAMINETNNDSLKSVTELNDFYSLSTVRDLIFHVKEHHFTLPQISQILNDFKLIFLSFVGINSSIKKKYSLKFPDDISFNSLKNWNKFEIDNPYTFESMYQFWVKKK